MLSNNYTHCKQRISVNLQSHKVPLMNKQSSLSKTFQGDPSSGHFRGEPKSFDESLSSLLEPRPTGVAARNVAEDPPPVTGSVRFAIAPVPVSVQLVVHRFWWHLPRQILMRQNHIHESNLNFLPTQGVRFSHSSDNFLHFHTLVIYRTLRDTLRRTNLAKSRLPNKALLTDRQSLRRQLSQFWSQWFRQLFCSLW